MASFQGLLTTEERQDVLAALALAGLNQQDFATREKLSYRRLNRMMNGAERLTDGYARPMRRLVRRHLTPRLATNRVAA